MEDKQNKFNSHDLEDRLARFAEGVIDLVKKLPKDSINQRLVPQGLAHPVRRALIIVKLARRKARKIFSIKSV